MTKFFIPPKHLKRTACLSVLVVCCVCALALRGKSNILDINREIRIPGEFCTTIAQDGAWCWFADPRAVYYRGEYSRTYIGWVTRVGDIVVASFDHATQQIETASVRHKLQADDHANPALFVRRDGRIMVFYSAHAGPSMYYRISARPEDITEWSDEYELITNIEGEMGYTYPNPLAVSEGMYLFWRGGDFKPDFSFSEDGISWSPARTLIAGHGARPYIKYESNGYDTIHFAFTDGHPRNEETNSIYYACMRDGVLYRAGGIEIKSAGELPLEPSEADLVYDGAANHARAWIWDIALDGSGRPVIVYGAYPNTKDHRYRYACWNGERWVDNEMVQAGDWFPQTPKGEEEREPHYSGGVVLDHNDPSIVYLSRRQNGVFEIERWFTGNRGVSWLSDRITSNSRWNNVRPVVPRGSPSDGIRVIWMQGPYVHYTDYATSLRVK
ncbi:BNR repeat-containing protein [bacterium]|nr:BNR repeat-containing protein [bacterium]